MRHGDSGPPTGAGHLKAWASSLIDKSSTNVESHTTFLPLHRAALSGGAAPDPWFDPAAPHSTTRLFAFRHQYATSRLLAAGELHRHISREDRYVKIPFDSTDHGSGFVKESSHCGAAQQDPWWRQTYRSHQTALCCRGDGDAKARIIR